MKGPWKEWHSSDGLIDDVCHKHVCCFCVLTCLCVCVCLYVCIYVYVYIYRVTQKNIYTFWHEKYYSIIVTTVFIQKQNWYERCPYLYIILHSHPEIEISFKFIPKILISKECIQFFWATLYIIYTGCFRRNSKYFRRW